MDAIASTPIEARSLPGSDYRERLGAHLRRRHPQHIAYVSTLLEEAAFGMAVIQDELVPLAGRNPPASILEVGAGAYILSSWLADLGFAVMALEPLGVGFGALAAIQKSVLEFSTSNGLSFAISTDFIEDHAPTEKYDLAFAINVFEHIGNLGGAFASVPRLVRRDGSLRVACPNYHFPYESHYGIPIIFSGPITRALFGRHIAAFDSAHDCSGLWESLNFVTTSDVARHAKRANLELSFDKQFIAYMFDRFDQRQSAYSERHRVIAAAARLAKVLQVPVALASLPVRLHPYMVFDLRPATMSAT